MKRLFTTAAVLGSLLVSASHVSAASPPNTGMPDQSFLDAVSTQNATWADMTGGVPAVMTGVDTPPLITDNAVTYGLAATPPVISAQVAFCVDTASRND